MASILRGRSNTRLNVTGWRCRGGMAPVRVDLSDDQEFFRETSRRFIESEVPVSVVREWHDLVDGCPQSWWRAAAELGWTSFMVPESLGGGSISGRPVVDLTIVADEMGRGAVPGPFMPTNVVADTLGRSGNPVQQSLLEGGHGRRDHLGLGVLRTGRRLDRQPCGCGRGAVERAATCSPAPRLRWRPEPRPITCWSPPGLPMGWPSFCCRLMLAESPSSPRSRSIWGRRFAEVRFDGVSVGPESMVGEPGAAAEADVERQRLVAVLLQCADNAGSAAKVLEFTVEYAFDRYSFGRPLASYQALKHRFADMKLWSEASQAAVDGAADALSAGDDEARLVSVAKSYVGDHSVWI